MSSTFVSLCLLAVALLLQATHCGAFGRPLTLTNAQKNGLAAVMQHRSSTRLFSLDASSIEKLEEMRSKFDRLKNVVSEDADKERALLEGTVEKYKTYVEIKIMMGKVRMMWKNEASEARKDRQLKSFVQLYSGKLELEEVLKDKLGLPYSKEVPNLPIVNDIAKLNKDIAALEEKLEKVKMVIPQGMSTRDERFFGMTQS